MKTIMRRIFLNIQLLTFIKNVMAENSALLNTMATQKPTLTNVHQKVTENGNVSVIIIGSGMAGISAARQLSDATNFDVLLLEANPDRYGGRIWSYEVPGYPGQPVELGAQWLHGGSDMDHPVKQLALKYAIPLLKNDVEHEFNENLIYDFHGKLLTLDDIPTNADKIPKLLEEIRENLIKSNSSDITYEKAFDILEQKYPQLVQHHFVKYVQKIGEESLNAATLDQISLIYGDGVPNSTEEIEYKGFDLVPPKGYRQILDSLISGGRGFQVELGRKVETIKYDASTNGRVELTAVDMKSNDQYKYSADHVIVAVPLGVLKANQINFIPKLPMAMLKAIENIGFGNFVKVLMVFDKSFWSNKKFFSTETETGFPFFFVNIERINNLPALCAVVISHGATMADELPESEVIKRVLDRMKIMFGSETVQARKLLHSRVTRWHNDPLVRGSYSFGKIGMSAEDAYNIRTPIKPHLFFAGEHTCFPENQNGNVHAAYLSGMRVANEIMEQHG